MTKAFIQLQDGLLPLGVTKETIENSLGYVPSDINEVNNLLKIVSTQSLKIENNITNIDSIKRNIDYISEMISDEGNDFIIRDEYGNVGLKLDRNGLFVKDVFANTKDGTGDVHKLSNKANLDYVEKEIGDLKSTISSNTKNINLNSESISSINEIISSDGNEFIIKDGDGNIGLKLNNDGLYVNDVIAGIDKLSNKADKDYVDLVIGSAISVFESITYNNLVQLRNNSQLIPGRQYRITDYVTTTTQENTQSAGHQFDIIVIANDNKTLSEIAVACISDRDTYFNDCNLSAWKIWYCLDNDTNRFGWANEDEGKGVIYRMIDEWGNDCPYDFKNIRFLKPDIVSDTQDTNYYYTFCYYDGNIIEDASISGDNYRVYNNVIKQYYSYYDSEHFNLELNRIMFIGSECHWWNNIFDHNCHENILGNDCDDNIFGAFFHYNTFGDDCSSNTFGDDCYSNIFGNTCYGNTFGNDCNSNTFGNDFRNNTIGNDCYDNTFGNECYGNTFGNACYENIIGDRCESNTLGDDCYDNTFVNYCRSNKLGNECRYNTFGYNCYYNIFGYCCCGNELGDRCYNNTIGNECYENIFGNYCYCNTFGDQCQSNTFGDSCYSNTLGYYCYSNDFGDSFYSNNFGDKCYSNTFVNNCFDNTFGNDYNNNEFGDSCYNNKFGDSCANNTFGNNLYSNTFGDSLYSNTFGDSCYSNTFGNGCSHNKFGDSCANNSFSNNFKYNIFGNGCSHNTFGNTCYGNTFGNYCYSNTFGNGCNSNTFGNYCQYNTFGNQCQYNTFGSSKTSPSSYYRYIIFDNGNSYINLYCTSTTSSSKYYQNVRIGLGVNNTSTYKTISDSNVGQTYETLYKPVNYQTITI